MITKSRLNVVKYINDESYLKHVSMQDSRSELIKLLLSEIIVDYFTLTSYNKGE
jgi:hypothetical protein